MVTIHLRSGLGEAIMNKFPFIIFPSTSDGKIQWSTSGIENVILSHDSTRSHFFPYMSLLDQSAVTGGGLDPYNVRALFVNMGNMWTERFGNYDCLVVYFE